MKIRRRMKRTTKQYFFVALICIVVIGGAAVFTSFIITNQIREEYRGLLDSAYQEMKTNQHEVYVAASDIPSGEFITAENVSIKSVYTSQPEEIYFTGKDIGKVTLVDIPAGTQLLTNMLTDHAVSPDLREVEYNVININSNIISNDTVDVRIFYPNGESYVILSKKILKGYMPDTTACFFWLDEEELLRMSAAIVDAGLYRGSNLYVTKYIEPDIQKASEVTYIPSLSVLKVLESNPNIVDRCSQKLNTELRKGLENRLAESMETDVSSIEWSVDEEPSQYSDTSKEQEPPPDNNPPSGKEDNTKSDPGELGNTADYFYYAGEAKEGEVEYGE